MKKKMLLSLAVVLVAIVGGVLLYQHYAPASDAEKVVTVRRGTIQASVSALGRVQPKMQLGLSTRFAGQVTRILVQEGDQIKSGALLLELESQQQQEAVEQAERNVAVRRLQLEEALKAPSSSTIKLARARLRRATAIQQNAQKDYDELAEKEDVEGSDEAVDLQVAKLEYEIAEAEFDRVMEGASPLEIERLRTELSASEMSLRQAKETLSQTRISAPFDGTIMRIKPQVGENVYGFDPLIQMADLSQIEIRAEIDEIDVPYIAEGQSVHIRLDAFPSTPLEGEIIRLMPGMSETRGATTYEAIIAFDGGELAIRPGMGANLNIVTETVEDALLVPRRAVRQVGRYQVVRLLQDRRKEVIVTTGLSNDTEYQILSGLKEGDTLLLD